MNKDQYLYVQSSGEVQDRAGRLLYTFLNDEEQWCFPRPLREMSPLLIAATIAAEDKRFYRHPGIDPLSVARAFWQNITRRRVVSGASTLSMQVVKEPGRRSNTLPAKFRQTAEAIRLELRTDKKEILQSYLNRSPYGLNLIGCEAAARRYFGKPAMELTLPEAALIAGLPKSPTRMMPLKYPKQALKRRNYVLRRMLEEDFIGHADYESAIKSPLNTKWHPYPSLSLHLAMRLRSLTRQQGRVMTTIDAKVQASAEELARKAVKTHSPDITNAAVLVVDVPQRNVLAYVGSAGFIRGSYVDVIRAPRSPGSTLKPFTYAFAMDRQCLYPNEMLLDDSLDYGLYAPENFDRLHHGLVPAGEALRRSLNVPAVTILERIGTGNMQAFLKELHLTTLRQTPEHYGLGLTLGTCEVRLDELAAAYCTLANLGEYQPLRILGDPVALSSSPNAQHTTRTSQGSALSSDVCLKIYEMLEQPLPGTIIGADSGRMLPRVCWKTGTSTGRHDAWTILYNSRYLVGVWMGNNDNRPSPKLVGAQTALPLAAEIFRALPRDSQPAWPAPGNAFRPVRMCSVSGLPASRWCEGYHPNDLERSRTALTGLTGAAYTEYLPRSQYLHRICDIHYPSLSNLSATQNLKPSVLERWPGSAKGWDLARITNTVPYAAQSIDGKNPSDRADSLKIKTPANRSEIILTGGANADQMMLTTSLDSLTSLSWYLNDTYVGASEPFRPLILPLKAGSHRLTCMTPTGQTAQARFEVIEPQ